MHTRTHARTHPPTHTHTHARTHARTRSSQITKSDIRTRSISLLPLAVVATDESTQGRVLGHCRLLDPVQVADRHGREGQLTTRYQGNVDVCVVREILDARHR